MQALKYWLNARGKRKETAPQISEPAPDTTSVQPHLLTETMIHEINRSAYEGYSLVRPDIVRRRITPLNFYQILNPNKLGSDLNDDQVFPTFHVTAPMFLDEDIMIVKPEIKGLADVVQQFYAEQIQTLTQHILDALHRKMQSTCLLINHQMQYALTYPVLMTVLLLSLHT